MGRVHGLPNVILDVIREHHGTSLVKFFYFKALKLYGADNVNEADYRYPVSYTHLDVYKRQKDAIVHGNRLIMMWDGKIILDIKGEEKKNLTVDDLLHQFTVASGKEFANDRALLG